ncbi:OmpA family protein [Candidatus Magnetomonas plexicatena]|uniref:OmpA family protein n=1 Tax=Candidatus Magnetomonas plexicatena TaxID=2552947 RepID=UPI001C748FF6|nr:OmpA family protein [Nitrospirales bacterium LBB_01]
MSLRTRLLVFAVMFLLTGCAGMEFTTKGKVLFIHKELLEADRAIETAKKAGKDTACPNMFNDAVKLRDEAYSVYWSCHTKEAIELANKVISITQGPCKGGASMGLNGQHSSTSEVAFLTVAHFDANKTKIKEGSEKQLNAAIEAIKQYEQGHARVEGHSDTTGGYDYNMRVSKRRAEAVKDYIIRHGAVEAQKVEAVGYGSTRPITSNETKSGRAQNRRADVRVFSN